MDSPPNLYLKPLLERCLSARPSEENVTLLAKAAFAMASTRLRQLMSSGRLHLHSFQIPLNGIAFDCIAELFERNEHGEFVELTTCFSGDRAIHLLDEPECVHFFRSLVFTSVSDGIFRMYREHDPVLAKILRNLKIALRRTPSLCSFHRFGATYLAHVTMISRTDALPVIPFDQFEQAVSASVRPGEPATSVLADIAQFLGGEESDARAVPLIDLAVVLKRVASRSELRTEAVVRVDDAMLEDDIAGIVTRAGEAAIAGLRNGYVSTHKIDEALFGEYASAIADILQDTFVRNDGSEISQVAYLQRYVHGLEWETYRSAHRAHFEYMVRKAKRLVQKELRELL